MTLFRCAVTWLPLLLLHVGTTSRLPRSLVFIDGGTYKFVIGLAVPVEFRKRFLSWSYNFQFQYTLPDNITEFTTVSSSRSLRDAQAVLQTNVTSSDANSTAADGDLVHRGVVYSTLESALSRKGVDGRACVLRSICEASETPLHHDGLIGELLHTLLTPDYGSSRVDSIEDDYLQAQDAGGREGVDCHSLYPECPPGSGLLDFFTAVEDL